MAIAFTEENFSDAINATKPTLVDFWAPWCGPCRAVAPIIDRVSAIYSGKCTVGKADIEDQEDLAAQYGIQSLPHLAIFQDGQIVWEHSGAMNEAGIRKALDGVLSGEVATCLS